MLTDGSLEKVCEEKGLAAPGAGDGGDRDAMIAALAMASAAKEGGEGGGKGGGHMRLEDGSAGGDTGTGNGKGTGKGTGKGVTRRRFTADSVPGNLHSMSEGQVRSVCAAHGMVQVRNNPLTHINNLLTPINNLLTLCGAWYGRLEGHIKGHIKGEDDRDYRI